MYLTVVQSLFTLSCPSHSQSPMGHSSSVPEQPHSVVMIIDFERRNQLTDLCWILQDISLVWSQSSGYSTSFLHTWDQQSVSPPPHTASHSPALSLPQARSPYSRMLSDSHHSQTAAGHSHTLQENSKQDHWGVNSPQHFITFLNTQPSPNAVVVEEGGVNVVVVGSCLQPTEKAPGHLPSSLNTKK